MNQLVVKCKQRILVVGCGLAGATVARELADRGYNIDIIDARSHVAGNAYDFQDERGFRIHKYGPHLYHTNDEKVHEWLSRFTEWTPYKHEVKAILESGRYITLPPNLETREMLGVQGIIDTLFRPYTRKMWGLEIEELDPQIIKRIAAREDMNTYYFPMDKYQYLPTHGYTQMVLNILDHQNIKIRLSTKFDKKMQNEYTHIFNSMPIDEYFDFTLGPLPYRSIKFTTVEFPAPRIFPKAVTNFTHDGPHTRVTEWNHLPNHGYRSDMTLLTYEEPCDYEDNDFQRFYPVKDIKGVNKSLYQNYKKLSPKNVTFIGRCGQYQYLDMHQAVASSLAITAKFLSCS